MRIAAIVLLFIALAWAEVHPLHSSSFADFQDNQTVFRFKIYNNYSTPTEAFTIRLGSGFDWFVPQDFEYPLAPDGYRYGEPYWEVPPMHANESMEVSFIVINRTVGLPDEITVAIEPLDRWNEPCGKAVPFNSTEGNRMPVKALLASLNRSQDVETYYDDGEYVLAVLKGYGSFAVFAIDGSGAAGGNVSVAADRASVERAVRRYIAALRARPGGNFSKPYEAVRRSKSLKYGPESDCMRISGMERFPCVDRETCLYACFSVPVCSLIGQSGWPFLDTLQDYNKSRSEANGILEDAIDSSYLFSQAPSYRTAKGAYDDLVELNRAETVVIFHPLFTSYGFCEPAEYGLPGQLDARRELLAYMEETCVEGEEGRIVNESLQAASKLAPPPSEISRTEAPQLQSNASKPVIVIPQAAAPDAEACCWNGMCSMLGEERILGLCWEWAALYVAFVGGVCAIIVISHLPHRR